MLSEEKINLLKEYFNVENMDILIARCPINIYTDEYNDMDNKYFINMIIQLEELEDELIAEIIKETLGGK